MPLIKRTNFVVFGAAFVLLITAGYYAGFKRGHESAVATELVTAKVIAPRYRIKPEQEFKEAIELPVLDDQLKSGWYVQLTAERTKEQAEKYVLGIKDLQLEARIDELIAGGKSFFRVLSGPYDNREQAKTFSASVNKKSEGKVRPFVVFVK